MNKLDTTVFKNHTEFKDTPYEFTMIAIEGNMDSEPFEMGDKYDWPHLPHLIRLSDFWLGEIPVSNVLWSAVMYPNLSYIIELNSPAVFVSWFDITKKFLYKLNDLTINQRPKGSNYRLPTEAEWEYAARGGKYWKKYDFVFSGSNKLNEVGWYIGNSYDKSKPVGLKTPNLLGLYDMSGNIWEWCEDWYNDDFYKICKIWYSREPL